MKKKKIGVLHDQVPFVSGGAELLVKNLVIQLNKRGYDAELIPMPFRWYPEKVLYQHMAMWRFADLKESNGEDIDLIISNKFPNYGVDHPNKICWLMHQFREAYDVYEYPYGLKYFENGERMRDNVIAFDQTALNSYKKIYTISQNVTTRLKKYSNIDSTPLYHPPALEGRYYSEEYGDYILSVGRLVPAKRVDLLLQAVKLCDRSVKVVIAGRGAEADNLKKLAEELGISDRVVFLGFVEDEQLLELYANAFAVYFSPVDEDYGYITLEALLSRKPVITSEDSGGVLEFVEAGKCGLVGKPEAEAIAGNIDSLYHNKKMCKEMGMFGYQKVKGYSWNIVIDALTESIR